MHNKNTCHFLANYVVLRIGCNDRFVDNPCEGVQSFDLECAPSTPRRFTKPSRDVLQKFNALGKDIMTFQRKVCKNLISSPLYHVN